MSEAILIQAARTWLPTLDPKAQAAIVELLRRASRPDGDPVNALRRSLTTWFGDRAGAALPGLAPDGPTATPGLLPLERLPSVPRPALWPQRPKRRAGELFSSWLRRTAIAAGVAPRRFVRDVVGVPLDEVDRDLARASVDRLAGLSGQRPDHLAGGLLIAAAAAHTPEEVGEDLLLRDGRFLLARRGRDRQGQALPLLQYCPLCLQAPIPGGFARAWRFAPIAVCATHACRLHDRCWHCHTPLALLDQRTGNPELRCGACGAAFSAAPHAPRARHGLGNASCMRCCSIWEGERQVHLDALQRVFRGTGAVDQRTHQLTALRPSAWTSWFGQLWPAVTLSPLPCSPPAPRITASMPCRRGVGEGLAPGPPSAWPT